MISAVITWEGYTSLLYSLVWFCVASFVLAQLRSCKAKCVHTHTHTHMKCENIQFLIIPLSIYMYFLLIIYSFLFKDIFANTQSS